MKLYWQSVRYWIVLVPVLAATQVVRGQDAPKAEAADSGLPVSMAGFSDKGEFILFVNEDPIVTSKFDWRADGSFEESFVLSMAGQKVETTMKFTPDSEGRIKRLDATTPQGDQVMERDGNTLTLKFKGKTTSLTLKEGCVPFENFSPALMALAVRRYDQAAGGRQAFPILILNGPVVMDGALERLEQLERTSGGVDLKLTKYKYELPGVDLFLLADESGKVYIGEVPAQKAAYVRSGFESLRSSEENDPKLSRPEFEVVEDRGVRVPMRDKVELSADVFRPKTEGKFPVVVVRTPYKKEMNELQGRFYARRGYAMVVQDVRGRFGSAGEWEPFVHEPADGYDTIEWAAVQPWSNSKVGMIGASYVGWVQWWAAREKPPHLVTIIPNVSPPDPFYNFPYEYGTFFILGGIWWADVCASDATGDLSGTAMSKIGEKKYGTLLRSLPVIDLDEKVLGQKNPYWRKWIEHPTDDSYWARINYFDKLKDVRIPVFHQSGWFDGDGIGSKLNYLKMRSHGHPNQKLVLGPWGHSAEAHRRMGDFDFGPEAIVDLPRQYLRWFDRWLKGIDNGIDKEPLVSLFVMGPNKWIHGNEYPLPQTRFEKWYLSSGGKANTSKGDGKLSREAPAADAPPVTYTYDPGDPTPNPDFFEQSEEEDAKPQVQEEQKKKRKAHHQNVTDQRRDILVYQSEPLTEDLTFAGPISAVLFASSSAKDTDWFVRLLEVEADGEIHTLVEGKIRARFRKSMKEPELLAPGEVYEYNLDLWQTGATITKGNRLRVEVASASFPMFSRNLNTGGHNEKDTNYLVAEQTIYHDAKHPSHILLPVISDWNTQAGK